MTCFENMYTLYLLPTESKTQIRLTKEIEKIQKEILEVK